jgi:hypothetical protein
MQSNTPSPRPSPPKRGRGRKTGSLSPEAGGEGQRQALSPPKWGLGRKTGSLPLPRFGGEGRGEGVLDCIPQEIPMAATDSENAKSE